MFGFNYVFWILSSEGKKKILQFGCEICFCVENWHFVGVFLECEYIRCTRLLKLIIHRKWLTGNNCCKWLWKSKIRRWILILLDFPLVLPLWSVMTCQERHNIPRKDSPLGWKKRTGSPWHTEFKTSVLICLIEKRIWHIIKMLILMIERRSKLIPGTSSCISLEDWWWRDHLLKHSTAIKIGEWVGCCFLGATGEWSSGDLYSANLLLRTADR